MKKSMTRRIWNYLRVRGEYAGENIKNRFNKELPPRARRIRSGRGMGFDLLGTTSACAENTLLCRPSTPKPWNYLRVRGEYQRDLIGAVDLVELPPRARRILHQINPYTGEIGTTSACAENT